jgi:hypothetical protein
MSYIMVDIESDGPVPGDYSMIELGAVVVDRKLERTFYGRLKPVSEKYNPEALNITGYTREDTLAFDDPLKVMTEFDVWIKKESSGKTIFISDNNGFDWMFVCWYFHHFTGGNPFGYSSQNLGSIYKGMVKDPKQNFKHLRKRVHTHNPVDDAVGNAQAFLFMIEKMGYGVEEIN